MGTNYYRAEPKTVYDLHSVHIGKEVNRRFKWAITFDEFTEPEVWNEYGERQTRAEFIQAITPLHWDFTSIGKEFR